MDYGPEQFRGSRSQWMREHPEEESNIEEQYGYREQGDYRVPDLRWKDEIEAQEEEEDDYDYEETPRVLGGPPLPPFNLTMITREMELLAEEEQRLASEAIEEEVVPSLEDGEASCLQLPEAPKVHTQLAPWPEEQVQLPEAQESIAKQKQMASIPEVQPDAVASEVERPCSASKISRDQLEVQESQGSFENQEQVKVQEDEVASKVERTCSRAVWFGRSQDSEAQESPGSIENQKQIQVQADEVASKVERPCSASEVPGESTSSHLSEALASKVERPCSASGRLEYHGRLDDNGRPVGRPCSASGRLEDSEGPLPVGFELQQEPECEQTPSKPLSPMERAVTNVEEERADFNVDL